MNEFVVLKKDFVEIMTVTYCDIRAGAAKKDKFGSGAESARKWTELQLKKIKWSTWWATMMAAVEVRDWVGERAGQRRGQFAPIARFQLRLSSWTPAPYPYKAKSAGTQRGGELCGWEHLADVSRRCFLSFLYFIYFLLVTPLGRPVRRPWRNRFVYR